MNNPMVSVVTISYNAAVAIEQTILSVINQTYENFEYIIIDGGSTDDTVNIIKKYDDRLAYWVSESDNGIYDAMNKGALAAKGDYVLFVNVGDIFATQFVLSEVILTMISRKDIYYGSIINRMSYGDVEVIPQSLDKIRTRMIFSHQATFVKKKLLVQHKFNVKYKYAADYDFLSRMYFQHCSFQLINIAICITPIEEGATYSNKWKSLREHRDILIQNNTYSIIDFFLFVISSYKSVFLKIITPKVIRNKVLKLKHKIQ